MGIKKISAGLFAAAVIACAVPACGWCAEFDFYGRAQYFTWKEYSQGSRLLEESGPVFSAGLAASFKPAERLSLNLRGEVFGGTIDYDGQTQAGDPVTTDTGYLGTKLEADLGRDVIRTRFYSLTPFMGAGARIWDRDIESAAFADAETGEIRLARGYTESWRNFYLRAGISGTRRFAGHLRGFFSAGAKIPIHTENAVDSNLLEPEGRLSGFAEAGIERGRISISAFYESMRFSESDWEYFYDGTDYGYIYQPESKADIFGIHAGFSF